MYVCITYARMDAGICSIETQSQNTRPGVQKEQIGCWHGECVFTLDFDAHY
jgi:hypothetical protein